MTIRGRLFRTADRVADLLGILQGPFDANDFLAATCRRAGMAHFDHPDMVEPLCVYLRALDEEASLSALGRGAAHWDVLRLLGNVARMDQEEAANPLIATQPITRPVFVLGLPRSGTSFLHNLIATDPAVLAPRCWQTMHPWPIDPPGAPDRRPAIADRQLRAFARIAPEFPGLHPLHGSSTQECTDITAHCFRSLRFDTLHEIPSYRAWLDATGHVAAYRFHHRFLRHLQAQSAIPAGIGRWVLKSPDHVFALSAIREVYPDAHLVFVHRDPLKVMASVARLTEVLRAPFTRRLDPMAIGVQVTRHWLGATAAMMAHAGDPARTTHIQYRALIADPVGTARLIYERTGMALDTRVAAAMEAQIRAAPNGGYGHPAYRWEDHGLDPARLAEQFRPYLRHFDIEPETRFFGAS